MDDEGAKKVYPLKASISFWYNPTVCCAFMEEVKTSLEGGDNVYLRGFGSFIIKTRAEKTGRNISKNTTIKIPAHNIPAFKPAKVFVEGVKTNVDVK